MRRTSRVLDIGLDAYAFVFENAIGKTATFLSDLASIIQNLVSSNPGPLGKELSFTAVDLEFANYGFYGELRYGGHETDYVRQLREQIERKLDASFGHVRVSVVYQGKSGARFVAP